jgi:uroporphyrin-III C-methyltransferase/precorrin-2 dehydrogenase/sirohydrochlorin ferrochelatase
MPATSKKILAPKADQLSFFPVFLKVEDRFAIVVGNGAQALARARLLAESRVRIRLIASDPSRELGVFAIQADADLVIAPFAPAMADDAALVFAATGDADEDEGVVNAARERGIPVNAVDRPELCDFYMPALVNRAPVCVAVGSEGSGPVLTQLLRARIEALLPPSTGRLAGLAARYRKTVDRLVPKGATRRHFWRAFFDGPVARCVESGDMVAARRSVTRLLKDIEAPTGFVSLVGAGPGAEDLLTLRAQRALLEADTILFATDVHESLVALGRRDARRMAVAHREAGKHLVREAFAGSHIVLLTAGDPRDDALTDAVTAALETAGIAHEIVPGVAASSQDTTRRILAA